MAISANDFGDLIIKEIDNKDPIKVIECIQQYRECMKDTSVGSEYVIWITEPQNITKIQKSLIDNLNIPPRAMAIKRMVMSRT